MLSVCIIILASVLLMTIGGDQFQCRQGEGLCTSGVDLAIVVLSAPQNVARRQALRATWFRALPERVSAQFYLASAADPSSSLPADGERADMVFLDDFPGPDSYDRLPAKTRAALRAAVRAHPQCRFVFKTDDDVLLRPAMLLQLLDSVAAAVEPDAHIYLGHFHQAAFVVRAPAAKFYEPHQRDCKQHLPYASGAGYALSRSLAQFLADPGPVPLRPFRLEDVAVGFWLAALDVHRVDTGFLFRPERDVNQPGQLCPRRTVTDWAPAMRMEPHGPAAIDRIILRPEAHLEDAFILQHRLSPEEILSCWQQL